MIFYLYFYSHNNILLKMRPEFTINWFRFNTLIEILNLLKIWAKLERICNKIRLRAPSCYKRNHSRETNRLVPLSKDRREVLRNEIKMLMMFLTNLRSPRLKAIAKSRCHSNSGAQYTRMRILVLIFTSSAKKQCLKKKTKKSKHRTKIVYSKYNGKPPI